MAEPRELPISEQEVETLKRAFKDNEYILLAVRSLFFGFQLSDDEKKLIKTTFSDPAVKKAVRKKMFPILDNTSPIGQVADFWMGSETQIFGANENTIFQTVSSKQRVLKMLEQSFALLDNPTGEQVSLDFNPDRTISDTFQVELLARNLYIKTVETGLLFVKIAAEQQAETPKQTQEKWKKNSAQ